MITDLFPYNQWCSVFPAPNAKELTEYVLNKTEDYTQFDWAKGCQVKTIHCPWQETFELLEPSVNQFGENLGKSFGYKFHDPWINCYEKGSYQEVHDHIEVDFASVFFPHIEEDFGEFFFFDRYNNSLKPGWRKYFDFKSTWVPQVRPGDIIFFPSTILHGVNVHKSDKTRKTLSCNYSFETPPP